MYGVPGALLTAFVLIAGVSLTWLAWRATSQTEEIRARDALAVHAADIQTTIENRLLAHEGLLRAGAGLLDAFWPVSAAQWRAFAAQLSLAAVYPGIRGIGFCAAIDDRQDLQRWSRALEPVGSADLIRIPPPGESLPRTAIVYLEPLDTRNRRAIGFDMMNEPARRTAMERARDQGRVALSARVTLVQEFDHDVQRGFLLYLPVYETPGLPDTVQERRRALRGYVYSPFRAGDFFEGILDISPQDAILEVFDGAQPDEDALLYASAPLPAGELLSDTRRLSIAGHEWTLRFSAASAAPAATARSGQFIAISGASITLLLAVTVSALALSRQHLRERVEADRALAQQERMLKETLERRVAERTAQLEAANRDLSSANRDLEAFTYTVSHDLRAPLRAIDSHVARFIEAAGEVSDVQQRHANAARRNIARMTQLIEDLLNFALVSRQSLEKRKVALWDLVRPIVEDLKAAQRIEFEVSPQELGEVHADPGLLRQALTNLLHNAAKFSRNASPPRIAIGCETAPAGRTWFVRDNGVGFDMRHAGKLFGVFERLHHAAEFEGMGVGLAIVKQIIERHGGTVWAQSEPDRGATFYFTLGPGA